MAVLVRVNHRESSNEVEEDKEADVGDCVLK